MVKDGESINLNTLYCNTSMLQFQVSCIHFNNCEKWLQNTKETWFHHSALLDLPAFAKES